MSHGSVACIVGPTASGKSEVAESVALMLDGEVVSVDSMQVYKGMDIGTAKVPPNSCRVPLHMIDVVSIDEPYSVAQFQSDARACVSGVANRGRVPVLCGGTGLYLDAVIDCMEFPTGEIQDERRRQYEELARARGNGALHELLRQRDLQSADMIHPNNVRRVIRALELADEGKSYAKRNEGLKDHVPYFDAMIWALVPPREELYRRINERVEGMFAQGLVEEVRALERKGLRDSRTACQAIGYKEVLSYIDGEISLEEAIRMVQQNTRRYAKRQLGWIKRDGRARVLDMGEMSLDEASRRICNEWKGEHASFQTP